MGVGGRSDDHQVAQTSYDINKLWGWNVRVTSCLYWTVFLIITNKVDTHPAWFTHKYLSKLTEENWIVYIVKPDEFLKWKLRIDKKVESCSTTKGQG